MCGTGHVYSGIDEKYCVTLAMFILALMGSFVHTDHVYTGIDENVCVH